MSFFKIIITAALVFCMGASEAQIVGKMVEYKARIIVQNPNRLLRIWNNTIHFRSGKRTKLNKFSIAQISGKYYLNATGPTDWVSSIPLHYDPYTRYFRAEGLTIVSTRCEGDYEYLKKPNLLPCAEGDNPEMELISSHLGLDNALSCSDRFFLSREERRKYRIAKRQGQLAATNKLKRAGEENNSKQEVMRSISSDRN